VHLNSVSKLYVVKNLDVCRVCSMNALMIAIREYIGL